MKILAIGTSNSRESINRELAAYAAGLVDKAEIEVLDINDYELPIYSIDREKSLGQPAQARELFRQIGEADALVLSFAEHNGSYTAAWKNLFDWLSRIDKAVFQHKPAVYLSAAPGPGGANSVLTAALNSASFFAAEVVASMSVPSFHENFDRETKELRNPELLLELRQAMARLSEAARRSGDLTNAKLRA
jgi:NAD(P)H-dependent FMN reductase